MFRSKATKKYAALDEAIARVKSGQPIESVVSAYPEAERASVAKMLSLVAAVQSLPKVEVPAPMRRRLYLDPAYQKSKNGVLAFINSFKTFGYAFTAVIAVFLIGGTAYAASKSLPGDTLFGLKTGYENVQLALAATPLSRAQLQVQIASERLADAQAVLSSSSADASSKAAAISELSSATSLAVNSVQAVVKNTPAASVKTSASLAQSVESLAAAQQQLVPAASVAAGQAQALADIQTTVATAQASQNPASVQTPTKISVTGKVVAIATGSITVDTNKFTIDPRNITITDSDGFNLSFADLAIGETVKIDAAITGANTNLVNVITILSQAPAAPSPTPTATPTPAATSSTGSGATTTAATTPAAGTQASVPVIPVKPNDTFGGVIFEN